jgi:ABC-type cobalamin/Fe3+-siderophores transport system ATPase subunit
LHDLNLAAQYADRICLLRAGKVLATGAPSEILTAETIAAAFDFAVEILKHNGKSLIVPIEKNENYETEEKRNDTDNDDEKLKRSVARTA